MIPIYKLQKLPRTVMLRKIAKYFSMAEDRLCRAEQAIKRKSGKGICHSEINEESHPRVNIFSTAEVIFFYEAVKLLEKDACFSPAALRAFNEAALTFQQGGSFRRALNTVKHLLLNETGNDPADWDFINNEGKLDPAGRKIMKGMYVYLEDIRSPFNVGAMFRTAESFGVERIFLSPFCADPRHKRAERTAMGCIDIIPWERADFFNENPASFPNPNGDPSIHQLPDDIGIFALETGGTPIKDFPFPSCGLLIAGSEELGVSPQALAAADASLGRVSIPAYGAKASLNVSVAFGIALQAWAEKCLN